MDMKWYLTIILIWISLMVADFEHFCISLLASLFFSFSFVFAFPFQLFSHIFLSLILLPLTFPLLLSSFLLSLKNMVKHELIPYTQGFVPSPFNQNPN